MPSNGDASIEDTWVIDEYNLYLRYEGSSPKTLYCGVDAGGIKVREHERREGSSLLQA